MTEKDYIKLAAALARIKPHATYVGSAMYFWGETVEAIARVLEADNPRFDRQRFYAATEGK